MKHIRLVLISSVIALVPIFIIACNNNAGGDGKKKLVIAVIPKGTSHAFWQSVHAGADAAGKELDVQIDWQGPPVETDYTGQINIVENAINRRVDGIVLAPSHGDSLVPAIERAKREGIPLTIFDSGAKTESYVSYVSTDNYKGGVIAAERMAEKLGGKGNLAILGINAGSVSTVERENGFKDTIEKKYPNMKIVQFLYGEADRATSLNKATDILTKNTDLNGFFASNESSAVGVLNAIRQKGVAGKIVFVGFDASPELVEDLQKGVIDSLVVQNPFKMGYEGVRTIVSKLQNKEPERRIDTGVTLVKQDNLNTPEVQKLIGNAK
jgi:ribose transport system substrate-binding protein